MSAIPISIQKRYKISSYSSLCQRVSETIGSNTHTRNIYRKLIERKQFIPAGNTLLAGVAAIAPNCCVLPPISESNEAKLTIRAKQLWHDAIGIGFDLSQAQDPVALLQRLSLENSNILLSHRPQRGNIAILNSKHPKIEEFIWCKTNMPLYNFNLSVAINDDVVNRNQRNQSSCGNINHNQHNQSSCGNVMNYFYDFIDYNGCTATCNVPNNDDYILKQCADAAYICGDPGIFFIDRAQGVPNINNIGRRIILPKLGKIHSLVPCGEQAMYSNEVCTLGSINLACDDYWIGNKLNEALLCRCIEQSVQFLDDVIDHMEINDQQLHHQSLHTRRIGLGVMGFADVLDRLQIKYGSKQSLDFVDDIGNIFQCTAHNASTNLADIRGRCDALQYTEINRRNLAITCIAPTGGISLLTNNKGFGIEPFFEQAHLITPKQHLQMQAKWQKYIDNGISKTINLPSNATANDIYDIFCLAKHSNIKSITVYRNGSMVGQPIALQCGLCEEVHKVY